MHNVIQSLWIGESFLSRMEIACIKSFLRQGYEYHLYAYEDFNNLPQGAVLMDANSILTKDKIFQYQGSLNVGGGSYAGFSNFFRFQLLKENGGTWVDADIYCLKRLPEYEYIFVKHSLDEITAGLIHCPKNCDFANYCCNVCDTKNPLHIKWSETGPALVHKAVHELNLTQYVLEPDLYFPIRHTQLGLFFQNTELSSDVCTVHFWNEAWRRSGMKKNTVYHANCLYEKLLNFKPPTIKKYL
jgi:hypothetical protein